VRDFLDEEQDNSMAHGKIDIRKKDSKRPVVSPNLMYRIHWRRELMRSSATHVSFRKLNISPVARKG